MGSRAPKATASGRERRSARSPSAPPGSAAKAALADSPLQAMYDQLTARIRQCLRSMTLNKVDIAVDLYTVDRLRLYELDNFTSVTRYAGEKFGMASSTSCEYRAIGKACHEKPGFLAALRAGDLGWSQAHELLTVIDGPGPQGEPAGAAAVAAWIERVHGLDIVETREAVGGEKIYRRSYKWTGEQVADVDLALHHLRKEHPERTTSELLSLLCRLFVTGSLVPGARERATHQIAIRACECGEKGERPSESGPIPVPRETVERLLCNADVLDERTGKVTRAMPAAARRMIRARGGWRCSVPGCFDMSIEDHHELGWRNGHDPDHCCPLCEAHHRQRHKGLLRIEGTWPEMHFYMVDGTYLGRAGDTRRATEHRPELGRSSREVVDGAVKALVKLEMKRSDAKALVAGVLVANPGRDWSARDLVQAALWAAPLRAGVTIADRLATAPQPITAAPEASAPAAAPVPAAAPAPKAAPEAPAPRVAPEAPASGPPDASVPAATEAPVPGVGAAAQVPRVLPAAVSATALDCGFGSGACPGQTGSRATAR